MASLKRFAHAKNHYIKDWDRIAGKQIHINTGIPHTGKSEKETKALKAKAETYLNRYLKDHKGRYETAELLRKQAENKRSVSIKDAIDNYLKIKSKSVKVKKMTLIGYKRQLGYFSDYFRQGEKLGKVTFSKLESLKDELAESRTPSGVDSILRGIKAFIRWSFAEYELNNLHKIIWRFGDLKVAVGNKKPKKRVVTDEEFKLVLFYANDDTEYGLLCKSYFQFARATGRRLTEICKGYINGNNWYYGAKGDDDQALYLENDLIQKWLLIQEYLPKDEDGLVSEIDLRRFTNKITSAFSLAMRKTILHNDIGFLKQNGYIPVDLIQIGKARINKLAKKLLLTRYAKMHNMTLKEMTEAQKRVALKRIPSFHSLRHSVCTEMVREKGIEFTRAFIGHSTIKTTEEYTHISQLEVSRKHFERN